MYNYLFFKFSGTKVTIFHPTPKVFIPLILGFWSLHSLESRCIHALQCGSYSTGKMQHMFNLLGIFLFNYLFLTIQGFCNGPQTIRFGRKYSFTVWNRAMKMLTTTPMLLKNQSKNPKLVYICIYIPFRILSCFCFYSVPNLN